MVKCPKGTPAQVKANLLHSLKPEPIEESTNPPKEDASDYETSDLSCEFELDSNKAEKRKSPTPQDELVAYFLNCILDVLLKSWEGKPCYKMKLPQSPYLTSSQSEDLGEYLLPCEEISNISKTVEYITGLYKKRSHTFSRDKVPDYKPKTTSDTNESEELEGMGEEGCSQQDIGYSSNFAPDEEVDLVFLNGAWYKGRVSRKLMDGEGIYFWEDGTCYKGDFVEGFATGKGRLDFPCLSVYEGGVYKALRHGKGLHCMHDSRVMYTGQWWLGKKHGEGLIVYNEPSVGHNFYRGQWENGVKEGFGYRQYPSGAKYVGFWSDGKRHGKGVMLWENNDIYRGQWKQGVMHGYGEYTWNSFVNKTLSYPAANTYRGYWTEGKRDGKGIFETINDGVLETSWECDMKNGSGKVICANGTIITAHCLFRNDKQATFDSTDDTVGLILRDEMRNAVTREKVEKSAPSYLAGLAKTKSISIPIHSSICSMNLTPHIQKLTNKQEEFSERDLRSYPQFPFAPKKFDVDTKQNTESAEVEDELYSEKQIFPTCCNYVEEEKYLKNAIISKVDKLKGFYNKYATLACEKKPHFKCLLLRLFFWQILIDSKIVDSNRSLVDVDQILVEEDHLMLQSSHNPFEPIRFGQFVHILLVLSWYLYGQHIFRNDPLITEIRITRFLESYKKRDSKCVLKAAFDYLVENDILSLDLDCKGEKTFVENDLAPMEAMYAIYRQIGEPHSARLLLSKICKNKSCKIQSRRKLPGHIINGKNALTVAGELTYIPGPMPFNFPEIFNDLTETNFEPKSEILLSSNLSTKRVMECMVQSCPGIVNEGYLVNMEHKLTFLEFYSVVIRCTELALKLITMKSLKQRIIDNHKRKLEEYERRLSEQEKIKDNLAVSGKKSRQVTDISKTGKK